MAGTGVRPQVDEPKIRAQLKKWQERLLDLTKGNPLLGLNRSRVSKLRIIRPEPSDLFDAVAVNEEEIRLPMARRRHQRLLLDDTSSQLTDEYQVEPGDLEFAASPLELARRLRRIRDNARTSVEERGVTTLHLTFGALSWQDDWLGESLSPVWMVPAQLVSKGPNAPLRLLVADEEKQLNPALALYLRERHKVVLPELPEEPTRDSLLHYLDAVQRAVRDQRWSVVPEAWLSTFSFESLVLYQDLGAMADLAVGHSVVAALSRATVAEAGSDEITEGLDDLPSPDKVPIPALPADGSQLEALTYGTSGTHLVIHGPPGTGKSQTISNLIADALGRSKKVLFVSSKMAALNVVHQRLQETGLARFCLEAHSTKAGKAKIVDELRQTLEADDLSDGGRFEEALVSLTRVRTDLNRYVQELHRIREPLGRTLYQAVGRVARLAGAPEVRAALPWGKVSAVSRDEFAERSDLLTELGAQANIFDRREVHPWRGFSAAGVTISEREQIEEDLRTILGASNRIRGLITHLQTFVQTADFSIRELTQFQPAFASVATLDRLPHGWFDETAEQLGQKAALFETGADMQRDFESQLAVYKRHFELPPEQAESLLLPAVERFSKRYRRMLPSYWKWRSSVQRSARRGVKVTHPAAIGVHALVCRLLEIDKWFVAEQEKLSVECPKFREATGLLQAGRLVRNQ